MIERQRAFHADNPTYKRDYYVKTKVQQARAQKKSKYRLTDVELDALEAKTTCDACGTDLQDGHWRHIDHDHQTGIVRGVLCRHCNTALGFFKDDPAKLRLLAEYLCK